MKNLRLMKVWPDAPLPVKAGPSINGNISSRAHQFCEPFLAANSMGFLIYPPVDFNLLWDGAQAFVQFIDRDDWILIDKIFLPDSIDIWRSLVPESLHDTLPVFLEAFSERGVLQVWTGLFADTAPGDSLWIRSPINNDRSNSYKIIEGIVETDWWAGPLFTNIEFTKTDVPVPFRTDTPFLQVFTIPGSYHDRNAIKKIEVDSFTNLLSEDYISRMQETASRRNSGKPGTYRKKVRNR
ncbi:DUF6065 family protein [Pectobacterium aquaticum]|uniref:DUF6065 family protein n=1 Tax=Pectobacterium aquaticum TaxID=2204145 RepID=UPI000F64E577|nr:DUF6065 family protein [Pectobacterium aquaticum]RRO10751.1 hypothetical protein DMB81_001815 [Pectobacterium aquaticum]